MKFFISLILFPFLLMSQAQEELYYVIHVEGNVTYRNTDKLLKVNDRISENAKIDYARLNDFIVISKLNGKELCLCPNPINKSKKGFWQQLSLSNLKSLDDLASRGDNENVISYLFFNKFELMNPKKIKVVDIPENKNSYYYLKYCSNGKIKNTNVAISKNKLLHIDNNSINFKTNETCNLKLLEVRYKTKTNDKLELLFYLKDIKDIKEEISVLEYLYKQRDYTEATIIEKLEQYLDIIYGPDLAIEDIDF